MKARMKHGMKARVYRYCTCLVKTCKFHPHSTLCGARVMPLLLSLEGEESGMFTRDSTVDTAVSFSSPLMLSPLHCTSDGVSGLRISTLLGSC